MTHDGLTYTAADCEARAETAQRQGHERVASQWRELAEMARKEATRDAMEGR